MNRIVLEALPSSENSNKSNLAPTWERGAGSIWKGRLAIQQDLSQ